MYGRQYRRGNYGGDIRRLIRYDEAPVTVGILAANVITFFLGFVFMRSSLPGQMYEYFIFNTQTFPGYFWTALTWPLVASQDLLGLIFGVLFFFWVGSSLERAWGTRNFGIFMAGTAVLTAFTLWLGCLILKAPAAMAGLQFATAAPLVAWAVVNRRESISLYGVLPIPAPVLAWGTVALMWFAVSRMGGNPLLGAFALSGCALAYWYTTKGRAALGGFNQYRTDSTPRCTSVFTASNTRRSEDTPTPSGNPLTRWLAQRKRKEQDQKLEDMFRRSGYEDEPRRK